IRGQEQTQLTYDLKIVKASDVVGNDFTVIATIKNESTFSFYLEGGMNIIMPSDLASIYNSSIMLAQDVDIDAGESLNFVYNVSQSDSSSFWDLYSFYP
ncbi:hypothetical protein, partial [Fulvivirga aurantia]|uniref:hypothetical protein n=1 Tax=Fulvivirga aurantia TaxID=2529383 RepID=UPI0016280D8D